MDELRLRVDFGPDVSEREADQETRDLWRLLERLDADRVDLDEDGSKAAADTRSADPATVLGALTVFGIAGRFVIKEAVTLVTAWLEASAHRSVTLEVGGATLVVQGRNRVRPEEIQALVDAMGTAPAEDSDRGAVAEATGQEALTGAEAALRDGRPGNAENGEHA